jgi:hypothetical protein
MRTDDVRFWDEQRRTLLFPNYIRPTLSGYP